MNITIEYKKAQSLLADDKRLAIITFDNPKSLNAQTLTMVNATKQALDDWQSDDSICAVVLRGAGDKAFCAGGDIRSLYYTLKNKDLKNPTPSNTAKDNDGDNPSDTTYPNKPLPSVDVFFAKEYGLIETLATYPKPILAWGSGIVMGGGLGILAASSHKVVTGSTIMAMPEVSIGLFPDAGGSYFLNRMMGKVGLFLGLTGARFDGVDAYFLGLADCFMSSGDYDKLLNVLLDTKWGDNQANFYTLSQVLATFNQPPSPSDSQVLQNITTINALMSAGDLLAVDKALRHYAGTSDTNASDTGTSEFMHNAIASYQAGSAITKAVTWTIYHTVATWSLSEILALELNVAINSCTQGDFAEGVRALLIEKDKNPAWQYTLETLPKGYAEQYLLNSLAST